MVHWCEVLRFYFSVVCHSSFVWIKWWIRWTVCRSRWCWLNIQYIFEECWFLRRTKKKSKKRKKTLTAIAPYNLWSLFVYAYRIRQNPRNLKLRCTGYFQAWAWNACANSFPQLSKLVYLFENCVCVWCVRGVRWWALTHSTLLPYHTKPNQFHAKVNRVSRSSIIRKCHIL